MKYTAPQRIWHRCKEKNGRIDIVPPLNRELSAAEKIHDYGDGSFLWMCQFHWPTTEASQATIAGALNSLNAANKWTRGNLPTTLVDTKMLEVTGSTLANRAVVERTVQMPLNEKAARFRFVGEE